MSLGGSDCVDSMYKQISVNNWHEEVGVGDLIFYYEPQDLIQKVIAFVQEVSLLCQNPVASQCVHVGLVVDKSEQDIKIAHSWGPNGGPSIETCSKDSALKRGKSIFMKTSIPKKVDGRKFCELIKIVGLQFSNADEANSSYLRIVRQGLQPHYFSNYSKYDVTESVVDVLTQNRRIDHYKDGNPIPKAFGCSEYVYSILQTAYFLSLVDNEALEEATESTKSEILKNQQEPFENQRQKLIDVIYKNFDKIFKYDENFYTQHSLSLTPAEIFHQLEVKYGASWKMYVNIS